MRAIIWLAILLLSPMKAAAAEPVRVPGPDGIMLNAELFLPRGAPHGASVLALHGCAGPNPRRDADWARRLAADGHVVLLPDSYGSRGLASQCTNPTRGVASSGLRRLDALAAARWLAARPGSPAGGVVLIGWSDGATTALSTTTLSNLGQEQTPGLIRGVVAFYPACAAFADRPKWVPSAPVLILTGASDLRSPPAACQALADRLPRQIELIAYSGAAHDFDIPHNPVASPRLVRGPPLVAAAATANDLARDDAERRVPAFIAQLPAG